MEKENQRIMLTRRLLKETLIAMLKEKPIDKISVTELCRRAEINRSTFYAHYNVPKDVLLEIKWDFAAQIDEDIDAYFAREVLPYNPKAKIVRSKTKLGYEIPFTRTFYEFQEVEPADEIAKRIEAHERSLMEKLHSLFGTGESFHTSGVDSEREIL